MQNTHYFRLMLIDQPAGLDKTEYYVLGTFEEVLEALRQDLSSGQGAYHALFYGENILLECWQDGNKVSEIDLHPFITYHIEGIEIPLTFPGPGNRAILDIYNPSVTSLIDKFLEEKIGISVSIAETKIELPELGGSPLAKGSPAPFERGLKWKYGPHKEWGRYLDKFQESIVVYKPIEMPLINLIAEHLGVPESVRQSYFYFFRKGQSLNWPPEPDLSQLEIDTGFNFIQYLADHILFFTIPIRESFIKIFNVNNSVGLTHGWHPTASLEQISEVAKNASLAQYNLADIFSRPSDESITQRLQNIPEELKTKGGSPFGKLLHYLETGEELPAKLNPELIEQLIEGLEGFALTEEIEQRLKQVLKVLIVP